MKSHEKPDIIVIFKGAFGCGSVGVGIGLLLATIGRFHIRFGLPVFITDLITIILSFIVGAGLYLLFHWIITKVQRSKNVDD